MSLWSRRDVARLLLASASAPALGGLFGACGAGRPGRDSLTGTGAGADIGAELVRERLRRAVEILSRRFPEASAFAEMRSRVGIAIDAGESTIQREATAAAVLMAGGGGRPRQEHAVRDLSDRGIETAARALLARAPAGGGKGAGPAPGRPRSFRAGPESEPTGEQSLDTARRLYQRARDVGSSRIVYRGAYVIQERREVLFVGDDRDLSQTLTRARAGVALVAWTGSRTAAEEASRAGTLAPEALEVSEEEVAEAAERALAQMTVRSAPADELELVFDPSVASLFCSGCVAPALCADLWPDAAPAAASLAGEELGSPALTLIDDPSLPGGFASSFFDDEGWPSARTRLVDRGVLATPLSSRRSAEALGRPRGGNGRRSSLLAPARARPSNLILSPGPESRDELIASVKRGLLLEGGVGAALDPRSWRGAVRAARAREISQGRFTGRRYAQVVASGEVPAMLRSVRGASSELRWFPDEVSGVAIARGAPYLLLRARVSEVT